MVGPSAEEPYSTDDETNMIGIRLRQWGNRVWTFPEVLLSPKSEPIRVYNAGSDSHLELEKNQFAQLVWPDKEVSRQLIDHYEGNLILSRLELVTIALECLHSRQHGKMLQGDHSYALMGLLLVRPEVDETDSDFQAFARYVSVTGFTSIARSAFTYAGITDCLWPTTATSSSSVLLVFFLATLVNPGTAWMMPTMSVFGTYTLLVKLLA
jgi:hypothetical protein